MVISSATGDRGKDVPFVLYDVCTMLGAVVGWKMIRMRVELHT
jgi:hypothetical protein